MAIVTSKQKLNLKYIPKNFDTRYNYLFLENVYFLGIQVY